MKLSLLLEQNPYFSSSAASNRALTLIEGLERIGVQIELLILNGYQSRDERMTLGDKGKYRGVSYQYFSKFILDNLWKRRFHRYFGWIYYYFIKRRTIIHLAQEKRIIWPSRSFSCWKIACLSKEKSRENLLFIELSEFLDIHHHNRGNFLQKRMGDSMEAFFNKKMYPLLDGLALMTITLMRYYSTVNGVSVKSLHLPMTVDLDRFDHPRVLPSGSLLQPYIAYVGAMNDAKDGVSLLIKAFSRIREKFPDHSLYLVGSKNYDTPKHQLLIKELNLEKRVFYLGERSRHQVPSIICNADLLVLPRPDSKQAQGGFPTKLGEYLATGNAICCTKVGEIPNYLVDEESVFFAEPGSDISFASAMDRALSDLERKIKVGYQGKVIAERSFNKIIQANKLYDFLTEIWTENKFLN